MYNEDDLLMLSGIQHYRFCPRQWALIHLEQQWEDNRLTIEGQLLHNHVDDASYRQKCGNYITLRSVNLASFELGLYGISDVIELHPSNDIADTIQHPKYPGNWMPIPIEYKHGRPKNDEIDEVQLAAQAMCLEEMYAINITHGSFYYGAIRHRIDVEITQRLRDIVRECSEKMHDIWRNRIIPKVCKKNHCVRCSLKNICLPDLDNCVNVAFYLNENLLT